MTIFFMFHCRNNKQPCEKHAVDVFNSLYVHGLLPPLNPNAIAHVMPILYCVIGAPLSDGAGHMRILPSSVTLGASGLGTPSV